VKALRLTLLTSWLAAAITGCAGVSPFDFGSSSPTTADTSASAGQPYAQLVQEFPNQFPTTTTPSPAAQEPVTESSGDSLLASMRSAGTAVVDALTIKPKVIPAADPVSLSTTASPVGSELHYHAARMSESHGNVQSSIAHYQQALQIAPNDTRALLGYARLLDRQQSYQEAEQLYLRAIEADPSQASARNDLGMLYARAGNLEAARQAVEEAAALQPSNPRYRNNAAIILTDLGRADQAYGHLAAVHPADVAHYNLGFLLAQRQMHELAASHLQEALALNPQLEPARTILTSLPVNHQRPLQHLPATYDRQTRLPAEGMTSPHVGRRF